MFCLFLGSLRRTPEFKFATEEKSQTILSRFRIAHPLTLSTHIAAINRAHCTLLHGTYEILSV